MIDRKFDFLTAVIGIDGATALKKAGDRHLKCDPILIPRTIISWLKTISNGYDGPLPGVDNSRLMFRKTEEEYSGCVSSERRTYNFDRSTVFHLASAISIVALDISNDIDLSIRDIDLSRLGKSIDLLVKTRSVFDNLTEEDLLMKAISTILPGKPIVNPVAGNNMKIYDYSHVLNPIHQKAGIKLRVLHNPDSGTVIAKAYKGSEEIGSVKGSHVNGALNIEDAEVNEDHQGKGLGTSLYEGLMAHAHHSGIKTVSGAVHSTMASGLHQKLSQKHGMEYKKVPTPFPNLASPTPGPYDNKIGPYQYTIKDELPMTEKTESSGPAHKPAAQLEPEQAQGQTKQIGRGPPKSKKFALAPNTPKLPKLVTVAKSDAVALCGLCGLSGVKNGQLRGCLCWRDFIKDSKMVKSDDLTYTLELGKSWDEDTLQTFMETFKWTTN